MGSPKDFHLSTDLMESIRYGGLEHNDGAATWRKTPVAGSCETEFQRNPALMGGGLGAKQAGTDATAGKNFQQQNSQVKCTYVK